MKGFFACPQRNLAHSASLLAGGAVLLAVGLFGAYVVDQHLALPTLVLAHALTILGPTSIKLGYILRLVAQRQMRQPNGELCCAVA